jgi:hypothetical protein
VHVAARLRLLVNSTYLPIWENSEVEGWRRSFIEESLKFGDGWRWRMLDGVEDRGGESIKPLWSSHSQKRFTPLLAQAPVVISMVVDDLAFGQ